MQEKNWQTVLIVEDEAEICKFASRVLELEGYRVLATGDAEAAVALVQNRRIDLVLLDLRLLNHDGWGVLAELKGNPDFHKIPVVVFTASAEIQLREKVLAMGATDCLVKPLSSASLKNAVIAGLHGQVELI
ncbi:response regulator [Chloroflexota bacterium]